MLAEELKQRAHKLEKIKNDAIALAEKINAVEDIKIATKVSATGAIYGSVTNLHVAEELAKRGVEVDRKSIVLKDVKEVGTFTAAVKLHREVTAEVTFEVVAEEA
jgi:large subunit ribosomal protein L9